MAKPKKILIVASFERGFLAKIKDEEQIVRLHPGQNMFDADTLEALKKNKGFLALLESGDYKEQGESVIQITPATAAEVEEIKGLEKQVKGLVEVRDSQTKRANLAMATIAKALGHESTEPLTADQESDLLQTMGGVGEKLAIAENAKSLAESLATETARANLAMATIAKALGNESTEPLTADQESDLLQTMGGVGEKLAIAENAKSLAENLVTANNRLNTLGKAATRAIGGKTKDWSPGKTEDLVKKLDALQKVEA